MQNQVLFFQRKEIYTKDLGRSNGSVNIFEAVNGVKEHLLKFGGHDFAIGMSVEEDKLEIFKEELKKAEVNYKEKEEYYDMILEFKHISLELIKSFDILEPFGKGNEKPTFLFKNVKVSKIYEREKIVSILFEQNGNKYFGTTFDKKLTKDLKENDEIYMLANLGINNYQNTENIQLKIVDIKKLEK